MTSIKKQTPSNCKFRKCHWNTLSPGEDSQECIACEGNKEKGWEPARETKEVKP